MKITAKHMLTIARLLLAGSRKLTPKPARLSALMVATRGLNELCFIRKMAQLFWPALGGSVALLTDFMPPGGGNLAADSKGGFTTGANSGRVPSCLSRLVASVAFVQVLLQAQVAAAAISLTALHSFEPKEGQGVSGLTQGREAGLRAEREAIGRLASTPAARNLLTLFFLIERARKAPEDQAGPETIRRVGVVL